MAVGVSGGALPCPAGPLILFLEFREGGLGSCQLTPPWPHAELWVTPAAPQDLLATAGKDVPNSGEETEVQRRQGLGPKPHSVLAFAVRQSDISLPLAATPPTPFQGQPPTGLLERGLPETVGIPLPWGS